MGQFRATSQHLLIAVAVAVAYTPHGQPLTVARSFSAHRLVSLWLNRIISAALNRTADPLVDNSGRTE